MEKINVELKASEERYEKLKEHVKKKLEDANNHINGFERMANQELQQKRQQYDKIGSLLAYPSSTISRRYSAQSFSVAGIA